MADDNTTYLQPPPTAQMIMDRYGHLTQTLINEPDRANTLAQQLRGFVIGAPLLADHRQEGRTP